ncbi:MAG: hypothetical protein Q9217_003791 [Psora testacea]
MANVLLCSPFASPIIAPPIAMVMDDFNSTSYILSTLIVSICVLGFATGPLVVSPPSEIYGRNIVFNYHHDFTLGLHYCMYANSSAGMLVIFRFLAGCFSSAPIAMGGGTITDVMPQEMSGRTMPLFVLRPTLGPSVGPVVGGYLAQAAGWRWCAGKKFQVPALYRSNCRASLSEAIPWEPN